MRRLAPRYSAGAGLAELTAVHARRNVAGVNGGRQLGRQGETTGPACRGPPAVGSVSPPVFLENSRRGLRDALCCDTDLAQMVTRCADPAIGGN